MPRRDHRDTFTLGATPPLLGQNETKT